MRKTCVRWAKPVLATLAIIIAVGFQSTNGGVSAQSTDPVTLPRLAFADFTYVGGFRLPATGIGGHFSYGGTVMAYNPARNSLFINSLADKVAEVEIPTPFSTTDVTQMPFAKYLQDFYDPTDGHFHELETGEANLAGLLVHGGRLYGTGSVYYDANNNQRVSHFSHSTDLAAPSFIGMSQVWLTGKTGYVAGYLANIPGEWQPLLGGPALTGQCCTPIVSRTSFGPAAFAWDPPSIGRNTAIPATPLLYYTEDHATLGPWASSNEMYSGVAKMGGAAVIAGTRTALFIGRNGLGKFCYGNGVSDPALDGKLGANGEINCYDPTNPYKGTHAYPYRYQIWAYDLADFAAVKSGSKQPWEVVPYAVWPFELPTAQPAGTDIVIGGVAYDAQRQLLYISQYQADQDGYSYRPIVHALKINAPASITPPSPPTTTTVSLAPDVAAPQPPGASIRWSAAATGGQAPYEYTWASYANGAWSVLREWSTSQTFDWQPTAAAPDARMAVWVRQAPGGSSVSDIKADSILATAEYPFPIEDPAPEPPSAVTGVTLTSNVAAPQPVSSTIVWTATPVGGGGALVYKWFVSADGGSSWTDMGPYAPSNRFTWTPTAVNANYRIAVWVASEGNTSGNPEAEAKTAAFAITNPVSVPVSSVTLAANLASPQPVSTTIQWTATASGGSGALVYLWFTSEDGGASWAQTGSYTSSNQLTWTPTAVNANYRVAVWVKRASNPSGEAEAEAKSASFAIIDRPVTGLALAADLPAPQEVASTIVWTATPIGGSGALVYKWLVTEDGATWTAVSGWTPSNQFTWTPTAGSANYRVSAWVKRASNPADAAEASAQQPFPIYEPVAGVALTTNVASPQPLSSTIEWTATPTGETGALLFRWFVSGDDGATWVAAGTWSEANQFSWTPTAANPKYRVTVWVKHAANPSEMPEASAQRRFSIKK